MLYLHDVWVNWFEGAIKSYEVPEFHEWRKNDPINLLDQLPFFLVKEGFFDYVQDGINPLSTDLVETIRGNGYIRRNNKRIAINVFAITDGERVLAVDLLDSNTPQKKSRLIPRQEEELLKKVKGERPTKFEYTPIPEDNEVDFTIPPEAFMRGLTRKEREKKSLLFEALLLSFADENISKLRYWYSEWDCKSMESIRGYNSKELMMRLIKEISIGWHKGHEELLKVVVKGDPYLEMKYSSFKKGSKKVG
jgi:hypothetical protein